MKYFHLSLACTNYERFIKIFQFPGKFTFMKAVYITPFILQYYIAKKESRPLNCYRSS